MKLSSWLLYRKWAQEAGLVLGLWPEPSGTFRAGVRAWGLFSYQFFFLLAIFVFYKTRQYWACSLFSKLFLDFLVSTILIQLKYSVIAATAVWVQKCCWNKKYYCLLPDSHSDQAPSWSTLPSMTLSLIFCPVKFTSQTHWNCTSSSPHPHSLPHPPSSSLPSAVQMHIKRAWNILPVVTAEVMDKK